MSFLLLTLVLLIQAFSNFLSPSTPSADFSYLIWADRSTHSLHSANKVWDLPREFAVLS